MNWKVIYTKAAANDFQNLKAAHLAGKAKRLMELLKKNPYQNSPPYEKLRGTLQGAYSRRLNIQHRLVYEVLDDEHIVKVISMWTHYDW